MSFRDSEASLFTQNMIFRSNVSWFGTGAEVNITRQANTVIISVSWKFSEMRAGTGNGQAGLGYGHKIFMEVRVCFYQEIQSNIYRDETERLQ